MMVQPIDMSDAGDAASAAASASTSESASSDAAATSVADSLPGGLALQPKTAQQIFLMFAATICFSFLLMIGTCIGVVFHFGDGIAEEIIGKLIWVLLIQAGSMIVVVTGQHSMVSKLLKVFGSGS